MIKHIFEQRVFYSDTDAYGIGWHGAYLRWMEMGRVYWTELAGLNLIDLKDNHDVVIPVSSINIKYKYSAKLDDVLVVETSLQSYNGITAVFKQIIRNKANDKVCIDAEVTVVAISNSGKLYRKMPDVLAKVFDEEVKCKELV